MNDALQEHASCHRRSAEVSFLLLYIPVQACTGIAYSWSRATFWVSVKSASHGTGLIGWVTHIKFIGFRSIITVCPPLAFRRTFLLLFAR
jgi:uncharacterized membrane protein